MEGLYFPQFSVWNTGKTWTNCKRRYLVNSTRYSTVVVVKLYSGTRYFKKRKCLGFRNDVLRNEALGKNNKLAKMNNKFCEDLNDYIKNCVRKNSDLTQHLNNIFQRNSITHVNTSLINSITHLDTDLIEYTSAYGYQDRETTRFKILAQHKRSKHILTLTQLSATCLMCLSQLKSSKSLRTLHQ